MNSLHQNASSFFFVLVCLPILNALKPSDTQLGVRTCGAEERTGRSEQELNDRLSLTNLSPEESTANFEQKRLYRLNDNQHPCNQKGNHMDNGALFSAIMIYSIVGIAAVVCYWVGRQIRKGILADRSREYQRRKDEPGAKVRHYREYREFFEQLRWQNAPRREREQVYASMEPVAKVPNYRKDAGALDFELSLDINGLTWKLTGTPVEEADLAP